MAHILDKLDILHGEVKSWKKQKFKTLQQEINDIQSELDALHPLMATNSISKSTWSCIQALELKRKQLLSMEEAT